MANLKATRKEFEDYVNLQRDGLVNMNEMDKVLRLTRLNQESYEDIINHYDEYVKAYPIKEFKYPPEDEQDYYYLMELFFMGFRFLGFKFLGLLFQIKPILIGCGYYP